METRRTFVYPRHSLFMLAYSLAFHFCCGLRLPLQCLVPTTHRQPQLRWRRLSASIPPGAKFRLVETEAEQVPRADHQTISRSAARLCKQLYRAIVG